LRYLIRIIPRSTPLGLRTLELRIGGGVQVERSKRVDEEVCEGDERLDSDLVELALQGVSAYG
jgi:hypothetical protein